MEDTSFFSKDIKELASFCGRCFGNLLSVDVSNYSNVESNVDDYIENVGYLVDGVTEKVDNILCDAVDDIGNFINGIGTFIKEEHLPPTPCCVMFKTLLNKLEECLDGTPNPNASCSYHS
ncbi:MAG: hypothetical protein L3V56_11225 [Candidatus Magnetoovum sp. WYHC-5]|nr:hypothetical protein [Candidatus Magnetoovum sp. WYHC-5]